MKIPSLFPLVILLQASTVMLFWERSTAQQEYVDNKQLDCYNNYSSTYGYVCTSNRSCSAYLTFRSAPPSFDSPVSIGYLLGADSSAIATLNNVTVFDKIPKDTILLVPLNCSCSSSRYFQYSASYLLRLDFETYFLLANDTYQGLTTCQALIAQNPSNDSRHLYPGIQLTVPLRCACPSPNQTAAGFNYLVTYLVTWGNTISAIAAMFGADTQTVLDANKLLADSVIYPFTSILVPLKTAPTKIRMAVTSSPPAPSPNQPPSPGVPAGESSSDSSGRQWVFVGVGIGAGLLVLLLSGFLVCFVYRRRGRKSSKLTSSGTGEGGAKHQTEHSVDFADVSKGKSSWSMSGGGLMLRSAVGSLTVYNFEEIQNATGLFGESNRIKGSVYRGLFNGDYAAVKITKGDVASEVNILKQVSHSKVIRLSGFCVHEGNTYLVYEYAENGSLSDWLHHNSNNKVNNCASLLKSDHYNISSSHHEYFLGWKQRVQIAYDIADALNYLHNFTNPPHIHKNLSSSNVLLDSNFRAKIGNFGLARSMEEDHHHQEGILMQLTRHVVGTQGYMPPEYIDSGVVTPKMDVFAFGVVVLELLSGREAVAVASSGDGDVGRQQLPLWASIREVFGGEKVREKLGGFIDGGLGGEYPMEMAYSLAELAERCVADDLNLRPAMSDAFAVVSRLLSSTLDWDPSDELERRRSASLTQPTDSDG
ncbi:protein LYK5 [Malania oleifera]|uniref:protein LYK5 n=1 Tax=Malania oleifera TaxID=397392 RepID=UPI0025AEBD8F|nr:protein LYK5 [Malania oleifera]